MQSLSLRAFSDFYTGMGRSWPGRRGSFGFADLETGTRRQWPCGIVACSSVRNGGGGGGDIHSSSSFLSRSQTYALLKQQMEVAAKSEDYKEAARLRDSLKSVEEEEPVLRLRGLMKEAVADERFEDAARYRDELKEIAPHFLLKCSSDATTLVPFNLAELTEKVAHDDRVQILKFSQAKLKEFISFCEATKVVPEVELETSCQGGPNALAD